MTRRVLREPARHEGDVATDLARRSRVASADGVTAKPDLPTALVAAELTPHGVEILQHGAGNQAVARLLAGRPVTARSAATRTLQRTFDIIEPTSEDTPEGIWNAYQAQTVAEQQWRRAKGDFDRYQEAPNRWPKKVAVPTDPGPKPPEAATPWLRVGDLYAGVTMTGNESWPGLVEQRSRAGGPEQSTRFSIFTGTHGNLGGQFLDPQGRIKEIYKDESHTAQDRKTVTDLSRKLGCDIRLIDIFDPATDELRRPEPLRKAAMAEIAQGRVVIFAWCYSMEAFKEVPPGVDEDLHVRARQGTKMKDIVSDVFGDVNRYKRPCRITFTTHYKTQPGQDVYVCGDPPELGGWDPSKARKLDYVRDGVWQGEVTTAPTGGPITYKYFVKQGGEVRWEDADAGRHHTRVLPSEAEATRFEDNWGNVLGL